MSCSSGERATERKKKIQRQPGRIRHRTCDAVPVLVEKARAVVLDVLRVVVDDKGNVGEPRLGKVRVRDELVGELGGEREVAALWHAALFVQQRVHAAAALNQLDARLVVGVVDIGPCDLLARVQLLLELEDVLHKLLLQPLVRVVDAELLKAIELEDLEAVDVEQADEARLGPIVAQRPVDALDEPRKQVRVDELYEGIAETCHVSGSKPYRGLVMHTD